MPSSPSASALSGSDLSLRSSLPSPLRLREGARSRLDETQTNVASATRRQMRRRPVEARQEWLTDTCRRRRAGNFLPGRSAAKRPFLPCPGPRQISLSYCYHRNFYHWHGFCNSIPWALHGLGEPSAHGTKRCARRLLCTRGETDGEHASRRPVAANGASRMSSTSSPTTSPISRPTDSSPTTRCSANILMPRASDQTFSAARPAHRLRAGPRAAGSIWLPARSSAPAIRSTSPSMATAYFVVQTARGATLYTQRLVLDQRHRPACHSTGDQVLGDRRPDHVSVDRSRRGHQRRRHHHRARRQQHRRTCRAAKCSSSASISHSACKRTAARHSWRLPGVNANPAPHRHARRAGRGREIERQRRRRDGAPDRDHPQLHRHRQHPAAAKRPAAQCAVATVAAHTNPSLTLPHAEEA